MKFTGMDLNRPKLMNKNEFIIAAILTNPDLQDAGLTTFKKIAQAIDLSIPEIIQIVDQLINGGILMEEELRSHSRKPLKTQQYIEVSARCKGICVECRSKKNLEIDHIVPVIKGGTNDTSNLQLLCRSCNRKKAWRQKK